ncbi:MAG: sigma-70 family RNA polymerase sigma factor [Pyrinomonadaceae bacterium]|nr:sigma-70 family RNA polymerase sigma factor [Pyrinomonadaceae bacterium]
MASPRRSIELRTRGRVSTALVKRIAHGDESAFATLYDTTCGLIYGLLLRMLGNSETAEQVLAAVYQEAWAQAATYDEKREEPLRWLITLARHRAIVRLSADSQERQAGLLKIAGRTLTTNPKTDEMISEPQRIVREALAALPPAQQQIIELAYFSGLRQNEIAAQLGLSLQLVQTGMRAGMMRLRESLIAVGETHSA